MNSECEHIDGQILWGKSVYETPQLRITQVLCSLADCHACGTIVERLGKDGEWYQDSEVWHKSTDYYREPQEIGA